MRRNVFLLLCVAGVAIGAGALAGVAIPKPPPQPVDGKIRWVYSYDEGKERARQTGKPLFVVFRCER